MASRLSCYWRWQKTAHNRLHHCHSSSHQRNHQVNQKGKGNRYRNYLQKIILVVVS